MKSKQNLSNFKQFAFKKIGYQMLFKTAIPQPLLFNDKEFVKIIFLESGAFITIDFEDYHLKQDAFFFVNSSQHYKIKNNCAGTILYYNIDFYCVEIHDKEVACDGILFNNVYEIPVVFMDASSSSSLQNILNEIKLEIETEDIATEEMLRTLLKQIIIKCTRIWKILHQIQNHEAIPEVEFSRIFSRLVENNYLQFHSVAQYATLLNISPKALNKRITRYSNTTPNDIIKNRIMLEAKRLLVHTQLSVKEISYQLGYEDASYFTRFFTKQTNTAPQSFRHQYLHN